MRLIMHLTKRKIRIASIAVFGILLLLVIAAVIINLYVINSTKKNIFALDYGFSDKKQYDCIIVLGAGLRADGSPSNMLEDRLVRASEIYFSGASDKILVTGDNSRMEYNETIAMKNYLVRELGVDEKNVVCDYAGFSTYDSIYRARDVFCVQSAVIVTQKYHLYRALYIAQTLGLETVGAECDYHIYAGQSARDLREVAARSKDFLSTIFMPKPKFLGEKIPIGEQ